MEEKRRNESLLKAYHEAFKVPVVYVNSKGEMGNMPGITGKMMRKHGFRLNGRSEIYSSEGRPIETDVFEATGLSAVLENKARREEVVFMERAFFKVTGSSDIQY